jgi:hypothetical protein
VIDYLASCANNDCSTVDKTALKFAKIDQVGLHNGPSPGNWAVNDLVNANNSWTVTVPSSLKAGAYVLRHEIVSLHAARSDNGAQNYPQCVNLSKCEMMMYPAPVLNLKMMFSDFRSQWSAVVGQRLPAVRARRLSTRGLTRVS